MPDIEFTAGQVVEHRASGEHAVVVYHSHHETVPILSAGCESPLLCPQPMYRLSFGFDRPEQVVRQDMLRAVDDEGAGNE